MVAVLFGASRSCGSPAPFPDPPRQQPGRSGDSDPTAERPARVSVSRAASRARLSRHRGPAPVPGHPRPRRADQPAAVTTRPRTGNEPPHEAAVNTTHAAPPGRPARGSRTDRGTAGRPGLRRPAAHLHPPRLTRRRTARARLWGHRHRPRPQPDGGPFARRAQRGPWDQWPVHQRGRPGSRPVPAGRGWWSMLTRDRCTSPRFAASATGPPAGLRTVRRHATGGSGWRRLTRHRTRSASTGRTCRSAGAAL